MYCGLDGLGGGLFRLLLPVGARELSEKAGVKFRLLLPVGARELSEKAGVKFR